MSAGSIPWKTGGGSPDCSFHAKDAIRSLPWPWWLYTGNGILLGAAALLPLLDSPVGSALFTALMLALCVFNYWAGSRMEAPYAVPRSRVFLACIALSAAFLASSILATDTPWLVCICAAGTAGSYALASVLHYRGTRR